MKRIVWFFTIVAVLNAALFPGIITVGCACFCLGMRTTALMYEVHFAYQIRPLISLTAEDARRLLWVSWR